MRGKPEEPLLLLCDGACVMRSRPVEEGPTDLHGQLTEDGHGVIVEAGGLIFILMLNLNRSRFWVSGFDDLWVL